MTADLRVGPVEKTVANAVRAVRVFTLAPLPPTADAPGPRPRSSAPPALVRPARNHRHEDCRLYSSTGSTDAAIE
jgi:hypothetical protein